MKKVFISADIEGVTGVTAWCETLPGQDGYEAAARQMTEEVKAACEAAIELGYSVVVKDGHDAARNIDISALPERVELIRGWRTSPEAMMGGLDESFDAAIYIGYHAAEGTNGSPLAHTVEHEWFDWVKLNGSIASEFTFNALYAESLGVPSIFISGDDCACKDAERDYPGIATVATKKGTGNSTWNLHPNTSIRMIHDGVKEALSALEKEDKKDRAWNLLNDSKGYHLVMRFKEHQKARAASWYPGAKVIDAKTIAFDAKTVWELLVAKMYMTEI